MGTKVHCESLFPGHHHSMRDLNNESNGCRWPLFYADNKAYANDQFYNDKDVVRRTMLEHEAVFKAQVLELHRVYRIQKDMMDELKRKQFNKEWVQNEASCSSQATTNDDLRKWKTPSFPLATSVYDRPSMSVVEDNGHSQGVVGPVPWQNGASSKNVEVRPTKIRRKMIDLCLPADEYTDDYEEVVEELNDHRVSQLPNGDVKTETRGDSLRVGYGSSSRSNGLADLNEPFKSQETNEFAYGHSVREHAPGISLHPDENGKQKVWPHQPLRIGKMIHEVVNADHYTGTRKSATPSLQPAKALESSSQPMQVFMNRSQRVMGLPNPGPPPSKAVLWRERTFIDLEADTDTNTNHESSFASHHQPRHMYPYNPPDSALPWNHMHSSWQNPGFGFPQRVNASEQRYPVNAQKQGCLGDRFKFESNARYNSGSGYSYPNGGRSDYRPGNTLLDSNGSEVKFVRDLNLNVTLSSNTSVVEVRKDEATLPWLVNTKSACNSEVADARWNQKSNDAVPSSIKPETEKINTDSGRDKVRMMLDINEPCEDADEQMEEQTGTKVSVSNKCHIDLNMSVSEEEEDDENCSVPISSRLSSKTLMIDLETVPESDVEEDDDVSRDKPSEESETTAAETIVDISLACLDRELEVVESPAAPETIILHWFAETVENLDQKLASVSRNQARKPLRSSRAKDQEEETLERESKDETSKETSSRTRVSSKHEVTEDIHMFDGFMRATGSSWTPAGLARKKTGSRGRPRRVVTIPEPMGNNIGEIEDRGFAGWGKMTRRPRRQRCPSSSTVTTTSNQRHAPFTWGKRRFSSKSEETMSTSSSYSFTEASCMQHWRKNWDPQRKNRLTSSTFAQAIGFWPNRRVQLWLEKIGAIEPFSGNAATCWTKIKELEALNRYHVLTGHDFVFPEFVTLTEDENWLGASPDGDMYGLVSEGSKGMLEVKCPYGEGCPWKKVPWHYVPQAQGLMEIVGRDWLDLYCWTVNGSSLFRIERDSVFWGEMKPTLVDFGRGMLFLGETDPLVELVEFVPESRHERCNQILRGTERVMDNSCKRLFYEINGQILD
ncbi:hypothetical protein Bca52824_034347 [Brassica carinata]|uniref:YqaJ viral recombinase domain-containing protein n=1 Tax=Brassica carinata TaxID=52824 RepID=A0A8X7S0S3_BRACI|nr:hypothetical protein Bca52824_034347 [Brassica carinata]